MSFLGGSWLSKAMIAVVLVFAVYGAYWVYKAGEHMAVRQEVRNVLTEKYRAPTQDAWKRVFAALEIPWDEERRLTTVEMKRYLEIVEEEKQSGTRGGG